MSEITKSMTDAAIVCELYARIEARRIKSNITQAEMAERIGITTKSYRAIEKGVCRLTTFVALLRQLDLVENLNSVISTPKISPIQLKLSASTPQRRAVARKIRDALSALPEGETKNEYMNTLRARLSGAREKLLIKDK